MRHGTLKKAKNVEDLIVRDLERRREETDAHGKALTSRKGKTNYGTQNK